jgi:hypothetical protein
MGHCTDPYTKNIKIKHAIIAMIVTAVAAPVAVAVVEEVMTTDYDDDDDDDDSMYRSIRKCASNWLFLIAVIQ